MLNLSGLGSACVAALCSLILHSSAALANNSTLFDTEVNPEKDGTYKQVPASSPDECVAICEADKLCRGVFTLQPDTRYPNFQCRLNNGFGENPLFPSTPPPPLYMVQALSDLNAYRQQNGLKALTYNPLLNQASEIHAQDLAEAGIISHTGTDGSSHADRVKRLGYDYRFVAENVATGQKNWPEAFKAWQDSHDHNVNLLSNEATEFGLALVYNPKTQYQTYWAMLVGTPLY